MDEYMKLAEECRALRDEYERKSAELDPLRWRLIEAQNKAEAAWRRIRDDAMSSISPK